MAVATITGLIAKENVVSTFGILFGFAEVAEDGAEIWGTMAQAFTSLSGFSFLVFNLIGSLIVGSGNIIGGLLGIVVFAAMIYLLIYKPKSVN